MSESILDQWKAYHIVVACMLPHPPWISLINWTRLMAVGFRIFSSCNNIFPLKHAHFDCMFLVTLQRVQMESWHHLSRPILRVLAVNPRKGSIDPCGHSKTLLAGPHTRSWQCSLWVHWLTLLFHWLFSGTAGWPHCCRLKNCVLLCLDYVASLYTCVIGHLLVCQSGFILFCGYV